MPVEVPTVQDIEAAFKAVLGTTGMSPVGNIDANFTRLMKRLEDAPWSEAGAGVQSKLADDIGILRVTFSFIFDPHGTGERHRLDTELTTLRNVLRSVVPENWTGQFACGTEERPNGPVTQVRCLAKGLVQP